MRMKVFSLLSVMAVLGAGEASAAYTDFGSLCTPGAVKACASVQVETIDLGGGVTQVKVWIANLQGVLPDDNTAGSLVTQFGFNYPEGIELAAPTNLAISAEGGAVAIGDPGSYWTVANGGVIVGNQLWIKAENSGTAGGIRGCDASDANPSDYFNTCSGAVLFSFNVTGWEGDPEVVLKWQSINNGGGISLECASDGKTACTPTTTTDIVPEPITTVLLGSGLIGVAGAGLRRRRKGLDVVTD